MSVISSLGLIFADVSRPYFATNGFVLIDSGAMPAYFKVRDLVNIYLFPSVK